MIKQAYLCVVEQHSLGLVVLAGVICALGSHATFAMGRQVFRSKTVSAKLPWALAGVIATSAAIWATHFVAMLAYDAGMATGFDAATTAASFVVALVLVSSGAAIVVARPDALGRTVGGAVVGLAVGAMHYTGMAGYRLQGRLDWDAQTVTVSLIVGCALAALSMNMGFSRFRWMRELAPVALLVAVCGAHFLGMSALTLTFDPTVEVPANAIDANVLTILTANVALLILGVSLAVLRLWLLDRRRREAESKRLRDLTDIAVEGLMICEGEIIQGVNRSLERIVGQPREDLVGEPARTLLPHRSISGISNAQEMDTSLRAADGSDIPVRVISQEISLGGVVRTVVAVRDQRARIKAEAAMHRLAHHDTLTGLPNRLQFNASLVSRLARSRDAGFALMSIDLDRFKGVNDTLGHGMGDELLRRVAHRLTRVMGSQELVARLGGDEFAIVSPGIDLAGVQAIAERVIDVLGRPYLVDGHVIDVGASVGIALAPADGDSAEELIRSADLALYGAKGAGRGCYRLFEGEMNERVQIRRSLEIDLRRALTYQEFELYYQPQVDAKSGLYDGAEALIRWHHPTRGLVSPMDFIPLAEETGLIGALGEWVLRTACLDALQWPSHLTVAVNLSPIQLRDARFTTTVRNILKETGLPGHRLELEVTETALLQDEQRILTALKELRALGIRLSMDDFGTGYSSLSYLRLFPFDKIKIDRSFVQQTPLDAESAAIVRAITTLGASLGLKTTAEGVETDAQSRFIAAEGCDQLQGYLFSRPVPTRQVNALFAAEMPLAKIA